MSSVRRGSHKKTRRVAGICVAVGGDLSDCVRVKAVEPAPPSLRWYAYVLVSFGPASALASPSVKRRRAAPRKVVRTYVGVAVDVERRARQHNGELAGGARSTRAGRPWHIAIVHGPYPDRGSAQVIEYQLKQRRGAAARLSPVGRRQ
jgi:putative endonuclease